MNSIQTEPRTGKTEIVPGMSLEWLENGKIVAYTMGKNDNESVDKLFEVVLRVMDQWSLDEPYLAIYEVADKQIMFTGYLRQRLAELNDRRPELKGRSAGVLDSGPTTHAIRLFMMARQKKGGRAKKYFTNRAAAVAWLKEAPVK